MSGKPDSDDPRVARRSLIAPGCDIQVPPIDAGYYPVSRTLYFYVKKAHVGKIPGIEKYLAELTNDEA